MLNAKRYLLTWVTYFALGMLVTILVNFVMDPYRLFACTELTGVNVIKPRIGTYRDAMKAYAIPRLQPAALILGNSRTEVGFDPEHPAWPAVARPVYNLGLPGTGVYTSLRYLQHAVAAKPPHLVVVGVDFMDFLVAPKPRPQSMVATEQAFEKRLLVKADGTANPARHWQHLADTGTVLFSLETLVDATATLLAQHQTYPTHLTELGFNPMWDYEGISQLEGYYALFLQRDIENIKTYLSRPPYIFLTGSDSSPVLEQLRQIIAICRQHYIQLHLVIYPYHAHLLEIFRTTGLWPSFERWKQAVVTTLEQEGAAHGSAPFPLWDFGNYTELNNEAIPAPGDTRQVMRWYWEAGHFKKELGDRVLERIFAATDRGTELPAAFGVRLTTASLPAHLTQQRQAQLHYQTTHPADVTAIANLLQAMRRTSDRQ